MQGLIAILQRFWIKHFVYVDPSAKCPACGVCEHHKIQWLGTQQLVGHLCNRCGAVWGESPVVNPQGWSKPGAEALVEAPKPQQDRFADRTPTSQPLIPIKQQSVQ